MNWLDQIPRCWWIGGAVVGLLHLWVRIEMARARAMMEEAERGLDEWRKGK